MKKIFVLVFSLICAVSQAQYVYQPSTDGQGLSRPVGVTNMPTDARSFFHDRTNFTYRAYRTTAEAISYLSSANSRKGLFPIIINTGGTLTNGVITGGTNAEWWFKDGVADGNLVLKTANVDLSNYLTRANINDSLKTLQRKLIAGENIFLDTNTNTISAAGGGGGGGLPSADTLDTRGANHIAVFGNSLGLGTGGTQTTTFPGGIPYAEYLTQMMGYDVQTFSVGGNSSTQIKDRFLANPQIWRWSLIFEMGTNNSGSPQVVLADILRIKTILDSIGNTRYLFTNIPGFSDPSFWIGTGNYTANTNLNNGILTLVGSNHYVDVKAALVAAYNPALIQDSIDHSKGIPPLSLMAPSDIVHFNDAGYRVWAAAIYLKSDILKTTNSNAKALTTASALELFKNAPPIKTRQIVSTRVGVNVPSLSENFYYGSTNQINRSSLEVGGNVVFWNTEQADPAKAGGIVFRNNSPDNGGKANMVMMGTNETVWNLTNGLEILNNTNLFNFKSPIRAAGDIRSTGTITSDGAALVGGGVFGQSFTNRPSFNTPRRPMEIINPGGSLNGGFVMPLLATSAENGIFNLLQGEMWYNTNLNRIRYAVPDPSITNALKVETAAFLSDLDGTQTKLFPGAGITVSGVGSIANPYIIQNSTVPPTGKIFSSTYFTNSEPNPSGNGRAKAFDSIPSTHYQAEFNSVSPNANVGIDFGASYILTSFRVRPADGLPLGGNKIQGSNTSSTTGFVDLYTLPSNVPYYEWSQYPISNLTAYRYVRMVNNDASNSVLAVSELEFKGYQTTAPFSLTTTGSGAATLNGTVLNIPSSGGGGSTDTTSLSNRINHNYTSVLPMSDSSGFVLVRPDNSRDTIQIAGVAGSGGSGGSVPAHTHAATDLVSGFIPAARYGATTIPISAFNVTGTPSSTTYLRGDGTWGTPAGGGGSATTNASDLITGTLADARLSANVPRLDITNSFTNNMNIYGVLNPAGGVAAFSSYAHTMHYGSATTYKSTDNGFTRAVINLGGTGNIIAFKADGVSYAYALDGTSGDVQALGGGSLKAYNFATTVANFVAKGDSGTVTASSLKSGTMGLKKMVVANESGTLSVQDVPTGGGSAGQTVIRNAKTAGTDSLLRIRNDTITVSNVVVTGGTNITVTPTITDTSKIYTVSSTGSASSGEDINEITASYTITTSNGMLQNIVYFGSSGQTITFPTTAGSEGMVIYFNNTSNNTLALGGISTLRSNSSTTSSQIDANARYKFIRKVSTGVWWSIKLN